MHPHQQGRQLPILTALPLTGRGLATPRPVLSYKEEGALCDPLRIRTHEVVLQFQTLEGEATYFLFSTTVVFGWRRAVPLVTKRPEIADRGLPPEDPFLLAN